MIPCLLFLWGVGLPTASAMTSTIAEAAPSQMPHEYQQNVTLDTIPLEGQRMLQDYSGLKREEILPHVLDIVGRRLKVTR